ncbi:hypothetical protein GCM10007276_28830 [Agaricicola taiwanensis]|uniref:DUF5666 domain-containing protein n=1 Tax=Agaricicola taiwanensis TaxID=591372 RepID=A0A8J3DYC8_9RHOB|nr:DUF6152 family protein [Agaricicola taiwanensis]GGE49918.1 hypothetical protein GCM10007276_28830 [Agaricicola taiwanensis]
MIQLRAVTVGVLGLSLLASAAMAHHGWSWAEAAQVELEGTVREIFIGPPHPTLQVEASDGMWTVELGNPSQTKRAGFVEGSAKVGDTLKALGNRSEDEGEKRMKAVQITVGEKTYDIYPERIKR